MIKNLQSIGQILQKQSQMVLMWQSFWNFHDRGLQCRQKHLRILLRRSAILEGSGEPQFLCSENVILNSFVFNTILRSIKQLLHNRRATNPDFNTARVGLFISFECCFKCCLIHPLANHRTCLLKLTFCDPSDVKEEILHVVFFTKICQEIYHLNTDSFLICSE